MDTMNVTQQMIAFQKQSIHGFQSIWDLAQAQTANAVDRMMDQATWIPRESRQAFDSWHTLMSQERERFSAYVDQCFAIYEKMMDAPQAATPGKTKKTIDTK
jgi:hypothetical protein